MVNKSYAGVFFGWGEGVYKLLSISTWFGFFLGGGGDIHETCDIQTCERGLFIIKKKQRKKTFYNLILHRNKLKYTQPHNK